VLKQIGEAIEITSVHETVDIFTASVELANNYHLHTMELLKELRRIYPEEPVIPLLHMTNLAEQIEAQTRNYIVKEETVEVALALVKPDGFKKEVNDEGVETYTAEIMFPIDRQHLLTSYETWKERAGEFGFHYDPYNFDSHPEQSFFDQMLDNLNLHPDQVDDIYFTGAITDPQKTDFYVEYKGEDGDWHRYTPDFLIRRKDGKCLIVEIKSEDRKQHPTDGENGAKAMATRKWVGLNPDLLKYEMIFTSGEDIGYDQGQPARTFIR
jgi:type III restriction enzyme